MKYIRTKDGRIIDTETEYPKHPASWGIQASDYALTIAQADTIEELCDEFVYYNPRTQIEKYRYEYYHNLSEKDHDLKWLKEGKIIYGAIWTKKGFKGDVEMI